MLDLTKTIPGLSYGLQRCKQGEKREIYIHPALSYGVHTYLDKGIYLKALVEVHHVEEEKEVSYSDPIDLSPIQSEQFHRECIEEHKNLLVYHGLEKRKFLLSFPGIDLSKISDEFQRLGENISLTHEETETLNCFFWNSYFSNRY
ncbi:MAG: hypothetical protein K940chlam9_00816 [Chlamydiae bacterium]|nr:hypothetical protein [Chlamydiota bacterium]